MLRDRKKQHSFSTETNHTKGKRMTSKMIGLEGLILEVFKFNRIIIWKPVTATWPAASWLDSSVGRALHRYRRGHGFESCGDLNFFQPSILQLLNLWISNCDDQSCIYRNFHFVWKWNDKELLRGQETLRNISRGHALCIDSFAVVTCWFFCPKSCFGNKIVPAICCMGLYGIQLGWMRASWSSKDKIALGFKSHRRCALLLLTVHATT